MIVREPAVFAVASAFTLFAACDASAQDLTVGDLASLRIHTTNTYSGMFQHDRGSGPGQITVSATITFGANGELSWAATRNVVAETPKGPKTASLSRSGQYKIGVPAKLNDGSGDNVWIISGNSIVRMRTMASGGHLTKITLTKSANGWTCRSESPILTEVGSGRNAKDTAAMPGGGKVEMLNIRQTGSSCRVTKA